MSNLLPCPFCGGEAKIKPWRSSDHESPYYLVKCSCGARMTKFRDSYESAVDDWNCRANSKQELAQ